MTCEIAIGNRLGIALAADSAVTFYGSGQQETYSSGANKIFQLAMEQPVAVMIYNDAALHGIPWELILKAYRKRLGKGAFKDLNSYQNDLVEFINDCSTNLLPTGLREAASLTAYRRAFALLLTETLKEFPELANPEVDASIAKETWDQAMAELEVAFTGQEVHATLSKEELSVALASVALTLAVNIDETIKTDYAHLDGIIDVQKLAAYSVRCAYLHGVATLGNGYTGVVIAGFGSDDYLPGYINIRFHGFIGSRVLWTHEKAQHIEHLGRPSLIQAFARQAMVETFSRGASPEVWKAGRVAYMDFAAEACRTAALAAGVNITDEQILKAVSDNVEEFTKKWSYTTFDAHLKPLWSVISGLAIEELAELAETLVMLESLKEKVTSRTQSVGGPIDLAVITKSEGLVWIKRKLYFDPQINHRYFLRLQQPQ